MCKIKNICNFFCIALIIFCSLYGTPQKISSLSLTQAIKLAHDKRPSLKALKFSTTAQKMQQRRALSGYLPHISGNHHTHLLKGDKGLHSTAFFRAEQLVYSFASPLDLYAIAKKDTQAAQIAEQAHKDFIRFEVEQAFFSDWLLAHQEKQVKAQAHAAQTTFEQNELQHKTDLLDKNDWLRANVVYVQDSTDASLYENNRVDARAELRRALGCNTSDISNEAKLTWEANQPVEIKTEQEYIEKAYQYRKELMIKQKEIEREHLSSRFALKKYLPSVSIFGNVSNTDVIFGVASSTGGFTSRRKINQEFGTQISWNIFDGLSSYHESEAAHARKLRATLQKQSLKQTIAQEVTRAHQQVLKEEKLLKVQTVSLAQAKNEYELRQQEQRIGLIDMPALDQATRRYKDVQFSWLQQRVRTEVQLRGLWFACGYPPEFAS